MKGIVNPIPSFPAAKFFHGWLPWLIVGPLILTLASTGGWYGYQKYQAVNHQANAFQQQSTDLNQTLDQLKTENLRLNTDLASVSADFQVLSSTDQKLRNDQLEATISAIQKTYTSTVDTYEDLIKLREQTPKTSALDELFTKILTFLAKRNYASASAQLAKLQTDIKTEQAKLAVAIAAVTIPANVKESTAPPGAGYSRQKVTTDVGDFLVDIIAGDLGSTRVIVDTASAGDCRDNCPVLSLGDYVARNGAFAGVNGAYFCPATYPSCAGKTNSFDTLLMNKSKTYFNSDNNVYSNVPAVIFGSGYMRFVGASSEWGRDTGIDSMIANQPLLLAGGNITFGGGSDPKQGSRGSRSFVANKGSTAYIGVVQGATVAEVAHVLKSLGMEGALNLDSGGSTALWSGGYKAGPGRGIPNAILFVRK